MLNIKRDINQQDLKTADLHFVKFCESRQQDTTSSEKTIRLHNLAVKGLSIQPLQR